MTELIEGLQYVMVVIDVEVTKAYLFQIPYIHARSADTTSNYHCHRMPTIPVTVNLIGHPTRVAYHRITH